MSGVIGSGKGPGHQSGYTSGSSSDGSVGGSGGGAPLCPPTSVKHGSRTENGAAGTHKDKSSTSSEASHENVWTRRSFAKVPKVPSTRSAAPSVPATTSNSSIPPALTLTTYPGPGAVKQHQSSVSALLPSPQVIGGVQVPVAPLKTNGRGALPGATTQSFINAMQAMTFNPTDENIHPAHKNLREQICNLQSRVWGLRQGMNSQPAFPQELLASFDFDMQEMMGNTIKLNQAADDLGDELKKSGDDCKRLEARLRELEHHAQSLKGREGALTVEQSRLMKRSSEDMRTIQYLTDQLRENEMAKMILQDQVEGKRTLWMDIHRNPHERAAALHTLTRSATSLGGPGIGASTAQTQSYGPPRQVGGAHSSGLHSGSTYSGSTYSGNDPLAGPQYLGVRPQFQTMARSHSGPGSMAYASQAQHQRPLSIPTGRSSADLNSQYSSSNSLLHASVSKRSPRFPASTEYGSPNERKRHSSSVVARSRVDDGESEKWAVEFQTLFALVRGFCTSYFRDLPPIEGDWKSYIQAETNGLLWNYINRVCQPGQEQDRGDLAVHLMTDDVCRPYLMERLIVQHMVVCIFTYEGWKDYSDDIDEEMAKLEASLNTINPQKNFERQAMIDRRAQLVTEMVSGPNAAVFRNHKINQHHQQLKKMVGPFLPRDKKSNLAQEAFYDLFAITGSAWDLSAKLLRSRVVFQYVWNDGQTRFSADAHKPVGINLDPIMLQMEHWRVKLCVTPAVTMRSDQDMTIAIKNILKAGVLVMRY